jgi:hypothetical protein
MMQEFLRNNYMLKKMKMMNYNLQMHEYKGFVEIS